MISVTDGKADDANVHNRAYLDSILVEMRLIDSIQPDLTKEFFGKEFASPITPAAVSHLNKVLPDKKNASQCKKKQKQLKICMFWLRTVKLAHFVIFFCI